MHHVCFRQGADSVHLKRAKFAHDQGPSLGVEHTSAAVAYLTDKHATGRHRVENLDGRATHTRQPNSDSVRQDQIFYSSKRRVEVRDVLTFRPSPNLVKYALIRIITFRRRSICIIEVILAQVTQPAGRQNWLDRDG